MKNRLFGGALAFAIALAAVLVPSPAPVRAAGTSCTGWTSPLVPPTTIRVYRSASGKTATLDFRAYVETVMAAEWGPSHAAAALQAGAVAVKQYAWYYAMAGHWRGGKDTAGHCYDVRDSSIDQVYDPSRTVSASLKAAVAATWTWSVRRGDALILTGYRPGLTGVCASTVDGYRLYQRDASNCASKKHWTAEQILRTYYGPASSPAAIVVPGANDMTGDGRGDSTGVVTDPTSGTVTATLYSTDPAAVPPAGKAAAPVLVAPAEGALLGRAATDATGDGRTDLVQLVVGPADSVTLQVMPATGTGFGPAVDWWTGTLVSSTIGTFTPDQLRLVAGDFDGDRKGDAGIVGAVAGDAPITELWVAASTGAAFGTPVRRLKMNRDTTTSALVAGDFSGDGRADLGAVRAIDDVTTITEVGVTQPALYLTGFTTWATEPVAMATIKAVVGDPNRDGRDDVIFARRIGDLTRILVNRSTGTAMTRTWFGTTQAIPWAAAKFSTADLNADARGDIVVFVDAGTDEAGNPLGTAIRKLVSSGTSFTLSDWLADPAATWSALEPY